MSELEVGGRKENAIAKNAPKPAGKVNGKGFKSAVEDHEEAMRMRDLLRRSITALCALAKNDNRVVNQRLLDFKKTAQNESAAEEIEKSLMALRDAIMASDDLDGAAGQAPGAAPNRSQENGPTVANAVINELQSIFLRLVGEFDHDFGEEYAGRVALLRGRIEKCTRIEEIVKLKNDIIMLVELYNQAIDEERTLVTEFITEMGVGLLELERQYLDTMNQTGQSQSEDNKFNSIVEIQVEDMKKSAQLSTTLAEFRDLVLLRLASIRSALEEKRRSEVLYQERLNEEMESLNQNLSRMKKEVDQVHEKRKALEKEVLIDSLTGVANRRALKERLKNEMYRFQRYNQFFSLLVFDLDRFKSINDQHGHWAGDRCLKEIVRRIKPMLRETDLIGRWGGDEFLMIFPATCQESAATVADRLRKMIQNTRFVYHKQEISLTISIGVTQIVEADQTIESVFNRADKAMYKSKKAGGNTVTAISE
ncbi:MAG: GGDEF domain-containing protein [Syntrophobacteraceae bacterium]|nr:GGDEF domain-containing protein [Syntrophobacteraceae bacterium]